MYAEWRWWWTDRTNPLHGRRRHQAWEWSSLERPEEIIDRDSSLTQDPSNSADCEFFVERHDTADGSGIRFFPQDYVTTSLTDLNETQVFEGFDHLIARDAT